MSREPPISYKRNYPYSYRAMARTGETLWPRFTDPQFGLSFAPGNESSPDIASNSYSATSDGHVYEEVGPAPQPPPYLNADMELLHGHFLQQGFHEPHQFRASPSSLCSRCSARCSGHRPPLTLPSCNSIAHVGIPAACSIHSSMHHHPTDVPMSLIHTCMQSPCSPHPCPIHHGGKNTIRTNGSLHRGCPAHNSTISVSNQRYTGTGNPADSEANHIEASGQSGRSLSPFCLLRKKNRDSKASSNNMLDNSSSKSLLMCSKKWILAISLVLAVVLVISVAVGLIVNYTVVQPHPTTVELSPVVERKTSKFLASMHVVAGSNSRFDPQYSRKGSEAFLVYSAMFTNQMNTVFRRFPEYDFTEVLRLRNGSVVVDFRIYTKNMNSESISLSYAKTMLQTLHIASNTSSEFSRLYSVELSSILVIPMFEDDVMSSSSTVEVTESPEITTVIPIMPDISITQPTTSTTATSTTPPSAQQCQPIAHAACQTEYYNSSGTSFPNFVGHRNQSESKAMLDYARTIMTTTSCYDHLMLFTCATFMPKCGVNNTRIPPCRALCEAARSRCGPYLDLAQIMTHIDCSLFPSSNDSKVCVGERDPNQATSSEDVFKCGNRTYTAKDRCDGAKDCEDGSDEQNCENFQCVQGQFKCKNGKCRSIVWRCDGHDDCGDNSDESDNCQPVGPCSVGEFFCKNGFDAFNTSYPLDKCISSQFTCDDTPDCTDGSDDAVAYCRNRPRQ